MPNRQMKEESYVNLGGINVKSSPYVTGPQQFLDIKNMDFQLPGSLTQRWGSTQTIQATFAAPVGSLFEFTPTIGISATSILMIGSSGQLSAQSSTLAPTLLTNSALAEGFTSLMGPRYLRFLPLNPPAPARFEMPAAGAFLDIQPTAQTRAGIGNAVLTQIWPPQLLSDDRSDFEVIANNLYVANRAAFLRYNGASLWPATLPFVQYMAIFDASFTASWGVTFSANINSQIGLGMTGVHVFAASYSNDRGFEGPMTPLAVYPTGGVVSTSFVAGSSFMQPYVDIGVPKVFPITNINLYSYYAPLSYPSMDPNQVASTVRNSSVVQNIWNLPYVFQYSINLATLTPSQQATFLVNTGSTQILRVFLGYTLGSQANFYNNVGPLFIDREYRAVTGYTALVQSSTTGEAAALVTRLSDRPSMTENYQNRLACSGFFAAPSTFALSDIGEPEGFPDNLNFDVRTNDGDVISGLRAYNQRLYIFKRNSMHEFSGDDATNFALRQISDEYGAINNRCVEVFATASGDRMVFLDSKGVMGFNGAALTPMSDAIQPIFQSMNLTAAAQTACMAHDKARNQLLLSIPVRGATIPNLTVVYDYLVDAWTTYEGFTPYSYAVIRSRFDFPRVAYGTTASVQHFGPSLTTDAGSGFTCSIRTRYVSDLGQTTQKQFRRLWVNLDEANNATVPMAVEMRQDYGASIVYSVTMPIGQFQNRIDFGIPAKSLSMQFSYLSSTLLTTFHGFGLSYRYQRNV